MPEPSDASKAFRQSMEGLVAEQAASVRRVEQSWKDTAAAAEKSAQEQAEKAQKLVARVRERANSLQARPNVPEIDYRTMDEDYDEVDPEVERFSEQLLAGRRAEPAPEAVVRPVPPRPARRSAPDYPEDDDFENQSWLR